MKLVAHKRADYGQIGSRRPLWISTRQTRLWEAISTNRRSAGVPPPSCHANGMSGPRLRVARFFLSATRHSTISNLSKPGGHVSARLRKEVVFFLTLGRTNGRVDYFRLSEKKL